MALEKNKIISNDALNVPLEMAENMDTLLLKLKETIQTLGVLNQSFSKNPGVKESKKNTDELTNSQKELAKVFKQIETAQARLTPEYDKQNKKLIELRTAQAQRNKQLREEAKATQQNLGPLEQLNQKRLQAQTRLKNLVAAEELHGRATKRSAEEIRRAQAEFNKLDQSFIRVQRSARQFGDNVGNYPQVLGSATNALKGFLGAFGLVGGIQLFAKLMRNTVELYTEFEAKNSQLQAVLGATGKQMAELRGESMRLGEITAFSASQVTELQIELAKLGFPTKDIQDMTAATLDGALAMGSGLGETATLVGATLRAFGLEAKEATRVNDVLAKSTSSSALDFSKLNNSMSTIAPVAKAFGFELEDTVALLGELSNAGFDASTAATATRNILLNLADANGDLAKALGEPVKDLPSLVSGLGRLDAQGVDLAKTLQLTDVRSVAAFNTFLRGRSSVTALASTLRSAAGASAEMARVMEDNLRGDVKLLNSAWEGLVLTLTSGEGAFTSLSRGAVQLATSLLGILTPTKDITKAIKDEQVELNVLVGRLQSATTSQEERREIIGKLQKDYPNFLKNLDTENLRNEDLSKRIKQANEQYIFKIALMEQENKIEKQREKIGKTVRENAETQLELERLVAKARIQGIDLQIDANDTLENNLIKLQKAIKQVSEEENFWSADLSKNARFINENELQIRSMISSIERLTNKHGKQNNALSEFEAELEATRKKIKEMLGIQDDLIDFEETVVKTVRTVKTVTDPVLDFFQKFAKGLKDADLLQLNDLLSDLEQRQKELNVEFDQTGKTGIKEELDQIAKKMAIVKNAITLSTKELSFAEQRLKDHLDNMDQDITDFINSQSDRGAAMSQSEIEKMILGDPEVIKEITDEYKDAFDETSAVADQYYKDRKKKAEDAQKIEQASADFILNSVDDVTQAYIRSQQVRLDNELNTLSKSYNAQFESLEKQIQNEEEGSQRRIFLEERLTKKKEEFAKKEAEIRRRQAKYEKAQVLASIAINTAAAIMNAAKNTWPVPAVAMIALAGATGAIQAALVAAQPLPQYESGTTDSAKDFIAGEGKKGKAFELVKNNKGTFLTKGPTLFKDMPHSTVYNHEDTLKILNSSLMSGLMINESQGTYQDAELRRDLNKGFSKVAKEIRKKPTMIVSGVVGKQVSGTRIRKLNALRGL